MKNLLLTVILCGSLSTSLAANYPCARITNANNGGLIVTSDPDWDDQIVIIDGKEVPGFKKYLTTSQSVFICGLWSEFGISFYDAGGRYARFTVSNADSRLTNLIDVYPDDGRFRYQIDKQTSDDIFVSILGIN